MFRPEHLAELTTPSAPFSERVQFVNGASTPPLQGGECACAEYLICSVISKPEVFHEAGHLLVPGGRPVPLRIIAK